MIPTMSSSRPAVRADAETATEKIYDRCELKDEPIRKASLPGFVSFVGTNCGIKCA